MDSCSSSLEMKDYFDVLELDWEKDQELKWIAVAALKAPLPEGWKPW